MKLFKYFLTTVMLTIACSTIVCQNKYFLCAFMDGKEQDLRYCVSSDGYHFTSINAGNTILKSTMGGKILRDPQILKDKKGIYHLITTNAWSGRTFGMWDSKDLIHWTNEQSIAIAPINADKTWAPEAIYNEKDKNYVFYWTSSLGKNDTTTWSIYYATTKNFRTFSKPAILYHSDKIILDANILKYKDDKYYMFYRLNNQVWRRESDKLLGKYSNPLLMIDANGEGPYVYQVGIQKWNIVWDLYKENGGWFGMAESENLTDWRWLTNKKQPLYNDKVSFPKGVRHGSIIPISDFEMKNIQEANFDSNLAN